MEYIFELIKGNDLFSGGLVMGAIYYGKDLLKLLYERIIRQFTFCMYIDESTEMYEAFRIWYYKNYKEKFRNIESKIESVFSDNNKTTFKLITSQFVDFNLIRYNNRYLVVGKEREKINNAHSFKDFNLNTYQIRGVFARKAILELQEEVYNYYLQFKHENRELKHHIVGQYSWDVSNELNTKTFDQLFFDGKEDLINDINKFKSNESVYNEKKIKFKRNYHFKGKPGTGKTAAAYAIANMLQLDVFELNFNEFKSDAELKQYLSVIKYKCLMLADDYDRCFDPQGNIIESIKVSKQAILKTLSGDYLPNGTVIVQTSNETTVFDEALMRTGRVDYMAKFHLPSKLNVEQYLEFFYGEKIKIEEYKPVLPMSDIEEACKVSENIGDAVQLIKNNLK